MGNSFLTPKAPAPSTEPIPASASQPETLISGYTCSHPDHSESGHTLLCRFISNLKA